MCFSSVPELVGLIFPLPERNQSMRIKSFLSHVSSIFFDVCVFVCVCVGVGEGGCVCILFCGFISLWKCSFSLLHTKGVYRYVPAFRASIWTVLCFIIHHLCQLGLNLHFIWYVLGVALDYNLQLTHFSKIKKNVLFHEN